jgi:hypothetical protein
LLQKWQKPFEGERFMHVQEMIQRLRIVGAKIHADDGRLEISRVPAFVRPLATTLKRKRQQAVRFLLAEAIPVWIEGLEEPILTATDAETASWSRRRWVRLEHADGRIEWLEVTAVAEAVAVLASEPPTEQPAIVRA